MQTIGVQFILFALSLFLQRKRAEANGMFIPSIFVTLLFATAFSCHLESLGFCVLCRNFRFPAFCFQNFNFPRKTPKAAASQLFPSLVQVQKNGTGNGTGTTPQIPNVYAVWYTGMGTTP